MMRITEVLIKSIKPIKPLAPPQARVEKLKTDVGRARDALNAERDNQKRKREQDALYNVPARRLQ